LRILNKSPKSSTTQNLYARNVNLLRLSSKIDNSAAKSHLKYSLIDKFFQLQSLHSLSSCLYYKFYVSRKINPTTYLLSLNFKRLRFFPGFKTTGGTDFVHLSLGLLNSYFRKGKFFLKSKIVYLALANFFRKLLIFSGIKSFFLHINRSPKYFLEILNTILEPVVSMYQNPFNINTLVNEQQWNPSFTFHSVLFTNPKPYGKVKVKQKGRLKRKINSRIFMLNRVLD